MRAQGSVAGPVIYGETVTEDRLGIRTNDPFERVSPSLTFPQQAPTGDRSPSASLLGSEPRRTVRPRSRL